MRLFLTIFMFGILLSCSMKNEIHSYTITSYKKVDEGYSYSEQGLSYRNNNYAPILTSEYINDALVSVLLFKSEGPLKYSIEDLKADTIFSKMLNVPEAREIEVSNQTIKDNNLDYHISEIKGDSIFCIRKDSLFIYRVK